MTLGAVRDLEAFSYLGSKIASFGNSMINTAQDVGSAAGKGLQSTRKSVNQAAAHAGQSVAWAGKQAAGAIGYGRV